MSTATEQTAAVPAAAPPKRKRGRESAADMIRSLGLVMVIVVPLWFLAQPGPDAEQELRVVDQSGDLAAWTANAPGAPVPGGLPGWQATVSDYVRSPVGLRLGWNTASGRYAEFAATTAGGQAYVQDLVGEGSDEGDVDVGGVTWRRWREADGSVSLVRDADGVTVVVGTRRATAPAEEVEALAATVTSSSGG